MSGYKINVGYIGKKIEQSNRLKGLAVGNAERRFYFAKEELLNDFDNHEITKEIESGPSASSSVMNYGNLFSFIGFNASDTPIQKLRDLLKSEIRLIRIPSVTKRKNGIVFQFMVKMPDENRLSSETEMPEWDQGSWVAKIERGISGLEYYLFGRSSNSRSGSAIQIKNKIRNNIFKGIPYLSKIFINFANRFKQ